MTLALNAVRMICYLRRKILPRIFGAIKVNVVLKIRYMKNCIDSGLVTFMDVKTLQWFGRVVRMSDNKTNSRMKAWT
jgi:hypothetical protein